nr:hypothetical protein [Tanacetum cinerariifolium]
MEVQIKEDENKPELTYPYEEVDPLNPPPPTSESEPEDVIEELEEARFSNTLLRMRNERVERDLYWTRVRAHEFYRVMISRGFVFEERPNEAIDVPVKDKKSPSPKPRGSPRNS